MNNLKTFRERCNISQETLARAADVSTSYVQKLEAGEHEPSLGVARRLVKVLGAELDAVFPGELEADEAAS